MKIKCPYCGGSFDDYQENCPNCGAANEGVVRTASNQPLTIEELKQWYEARNLPPYEITRFFLGIDYKGPRAFGIYKDESKNIFTVYKNKDDGSRAIRYIGTDEAYAVNELYQRLKQEILEQKSRNTTSVAAAKEQKTRHFILYAFLAAIFAIVLFSTFSSSKKSGPATGYYAYNNNSYYHIDDTYNHHNGHWYAYENDEWITVDYEDLPGALQSERAEDFYTTYSWDPSTQTRDFSISSAAAYYEQEADLWENQDDDSDYDWDDSSWDSDSSDWSSDW